MNERKKLSHVQWTSKLFHIENHKIRVGLY